MIYGRRSYWFKTLFFIELPISFKFIIQGCLEFSQDSPKDIVDLIFVEVLGNFPIPHLLDLVCSIPKWNARVDNYVTSIFGFVDNYLTRDGCILFLYNDNFWVLKNIKSYLEDYNFKIHSKFTIVNNMHRTNPEFPTKKKNIIWIPPRFLASAWAQY